MKIDIHPHERIDNILDFVRRLSILLSDTGYDTKVVTREASTTIESLEIYKIEESD